MSLLTKEERLEKLAFWTKNAEGADTYTLALGYVSYLQGMATAWYYDGELSFADWDEVYSHGNKILDKFLHTKG